MNDNGCCKNVKSAVILSTSPRRDSSVRTAQFLHKNGHCGAQNNGTQYNSTQYSVSNAECHYTAYCYSEYYCVECHMLIFGVLSVGVLIVVF